MATLIMSLYNPFLRSATGIAWNTVEVSGAACASTPACARVSRNTGSVFTRFAVRELLVRICRFPSMV